uniref:Uncharacterized protein n=1 Tax=Oncorhynchus mykiss TaxID=8022 RepID=A0A8C7TMU4_ONCMY
QLLGIETTEYLSPSQQWGHFIGQCILYGTVEYNTFSLVRESPTISVSVAIYWFYTSWKDWLNVTLGGCVKILFLLAVSGTASFCLPFKTFSPYDGNQFYTGVNNAEKSVWVNFFFWVLIVAVVFVQKRQGQNGVRLKQNPSSTDLSDPTDLTYSPMGAIMCLWI